MSLFDDRNLGFGFVAGNSCYHAATRTGSSRRRGSPGPTGDGRRGRVLGKMRTTLLVASVLIILTAAVCVLATLTGWISDRRRDFALMKALGASGRMLQGFFAAEAAALGAAGSIMGFALGLGVAIWIGQANFHAPVTPRLERFSGGFRGRHPHCAAGGDSADIAAAAGATC